MVGMKYVAAGLIAILVLSVSYFLLLPIEEPVRNLIGWVDLSSGDMRWWRGGAGLTMAACVFRLVVMWRNNTALERRKTLAARARA
jgi:hypothetical protein